MKESLLEKIKKASVSNEPAYVNFYNDGKFDIDERKVEDRMTDHYLDDFIDTISFVFCDAARYCAMDFPYDKISLGLKVGLIYNINDVENNIIKENAKPIDGIVRCHTGDVISSKDGVENDKEDYIGRQGFVVYDKLISEMEKNGLDFNGPKTFDEFKESILSKKIFDISLIADVNKKEKHEDEIKEIKETPKIKKLVFPFGKRRS